MIDKLLMMLGKSLVGGSAKQTVPQQTKTSPRSELPRPVTSTPVTKPYTPPRTNRSYTKSKGTQIDVRPTLQLIDRTTNAALPASINTKIGVQTRDAIAREGVSLVNVSTVSPLVQSNFEVIGKQINLLTDSLMKIDKRFIEHDKHVNLKISKVAEHTLKFTEKFTRAFDGRIDDVERNIMAFDDRLDFHDSQIDKLTSELRFLKTSQSANKAQAAPQARAGIQAPSAMGPKAAAGMGIVGAGLAAYFLSDAIQGKGPMGEALKKALGGKTPAEYVKDLAWDAVKAATAAVANKAANAIKKADEAVSKRIENNIKERWKEEQERKKRPWSWKPYWLQGHKGTQQQQQPTPEVQRFKPQSGMSGQDPVPETLYFEAKREIVMKAEKIVFDAKKIEFKGTVQGMKAGIAHSGQVPGYAPPSKLGGPPQSPMGISDPRASGPALPTSTPSVKDPFESTRAGQMISPSFAAPSGGSGLNAGVFNQGSNSPHSSWTPGSGVNPATGLNATVFNQDNGMYRDPATGKTSGTPPPGWTPSGGAKMSDLDAAAVYNIPKSDRAATKGQDRTQIYKTGTDRFQYKQGTVGGVDPTLLHVMREASKDLPDGYTVEMISGRDARTKTRQHPNGFAVDVQIYDDKGNALKNLGAGKGYGVYERYYHSSAVRAKKLYPDEKMLWGGGFGSGVPNDKMHLQWLRKNVRGSSQGMAAYDEQKGINPRFKHFDPYNEAMTPEEIKEYREGVAKNIETLGPAATVQDERPAVVAPTPISERGFLTSIGHPGLAKDPGPGTALKDAGPGAALAAADQRGLTAPSIAPTNVNLVGGPTMGVKDSGPGSLGGTIAALENIRAQDVGSNKASTALGQIRQEHFGQLSDQQIMAIASMGKTEVGGMSPESKKKWLEATLNRAQLQGKGVDNSFFRTKYWQSRGKRVSQADLEEWRGYTSDVMAGQNLTNYMTDNASNAPGNRLADNRARTRRIPGMWTEGTTGDYMKDRNKGEYLYVDTHYEKRREALMQRVAERERSGTPTQQLAMNLGGPKRPGLPALRKAQGMQPQNNAKPGSTAYFDPRKRAANPLRGHERLKKSIGATPPKQTTDKIERTAQKASNGAITGGSAKDAKQRVDQKGGNGAITGGREKPKGEGKKAGGEGDWLGAAQGQGISTPRDNSADSMPADAGGSGTGDYANCLI